MPKGEPFRLLPDGMELRQTSRIAGVGFLGREVRSDEPVFGNSDVKRLGDRVRELERVRGARR